MATNNQKTIAEDILRLRLSQIIVNEHYKAGKFKIPIHLALGHEAIVIGVCQIMENDDKLILSHRNIAYNLARVGKLKPLLDEYFLKPTGIMEGSAGSMNLVNPSQGIIYSSSILGNNFAVATGVAMAQKILSKNGLTIVLGGDGAIEEGSFHESLLMFKSLKLPSLVIIENNEWSMATKIDQRRHPINLEKLCQAYDIKYEKLNGNDPYKYIDELKKFRNFSLKNETPVCIEVSVTTLGDWRMKTPEYPDGKFINYHAGPTPAIDINNPVTIRETEEDPVFVLRNYFKTDEIEKMTALLRSELGDLL